MRPKDLIDQLLIKGLHNGFRVKLVLVNRFTIAIVTDEDNQLIEAYVSRDGKIVPLPLESLINDWQEHRPTVGVKPSELPD